MRKEVDMAGYCGFSKSNNAIIAENEGKFSATQAAKILGCKADAIRAILKPCEWHHTGKMFKCTDYFDISELMNPEEAENIELLQKLKNFKKEKRADKFLANVEFLTWEGTLKHPKAIRHEGKAVVEKNGKKLTINLDGEVFVKMEGSRGTFIQKIEE